MTARRRKNNKGKRTQGKSRGEFAGRSGISFAVGTTSEQRALLIILGVAVALRVIYAIELHGSQFYGTFISDSSVMHTWGQRIADGILSDRRPFFRAPLYGLFVGILYAVFGASHLTIIIPQMFLGLGIVYLVFVYARFLFDRNIATVSAAIAAVYPTLIYFEAELLMTTFTIFLGLLALILMHQAVIIPSRRNLFIAGLVLGLVVITRPTFLLIGPLLPLAIYFRGKREFTKKLVNRTALFALAVILPIIPVTMHNIIAGDEFVVVSSQFGANFYLGNSEEADGITIRQMGFGSIESYYQDNILSIDAASQEVGRKLSDAETSSYWAKRALEDILADPTRAIGLYLKKVYLFWHGQEIFNVKSLYYAGEYSALMDSILWRHGLNFPSGVLFPLMLAGIFFAYRQRADLLLPISFMVVYTLVVSLFFVNARFRQPLIPLAIIFAAVAVVYAVRLWKKREFGAIAVGAAVFAIFLVTLNLGEDVDSDENRSEYAVHMGTLAFSDQDFTEAARYFEQALEIFPRNGRAYTKLGATYAELGRFEDAISILGQGINAAPDYAPLWSNLGVVYARMDNPGRAKLSFQRAIEAEPTLPDAHFGLAQIYEFEGKLDSARAEYQETLRLRPDHRYARQRLQMLTQ